MHSSYLRIFRNLFVVYNSDGENNTRLLLMNNERVISATNIIILALHFRTYSAPPRAYGARSVALATR